MKYLKIFFRILNIFYMTIPSIGLQMAPRTGKAWEPVSKGRTAIRALRSPWDPTPQFYKPRTRAYSNAHAKCTIVTAAETSASAQIAEWPSRIRRVSDTLDAGLRCLDRKSVV